MTRPGIEPTTPAPEADALTITLSESVIRYQGAWENWKTFEGSWGLLEENIFSFRKLGASKKIGSWGHFSFSELGANTPLEGYTAAELHFCKIMSSHDASDIYFLCTRVNNFQ